MLRSRPRECCQEAGNEGGLPYESAPCPVRPPFQSAPTSHRSGREPTRIVFPRPRRRTRILHKIPRKMPADGRASSPSAHNRFRTTSEDDDVGHAQPRRVLIRRMRQAKEDCWNHDSDDHPPPCFGDALGQVPDRYPRYAASSPKATAATATTPTRIVATKGWPGDGAKLSVTFTQPTASSTARPPTGEARPTPVRSRGRSTTSG